MKKVSLITLLLFAFLGLFGWPVFGANYSIEPASPPSDFGSTNLSSSFGGCYHVMPPLADLNGIGELGYFLSPVWNFVINSDSGKVGELVSIDLTFNVSTYLDIDDELLKLKPDEFYVEYPFGVYLFENVVIDEVYSEFMSADEFLYYWAIGTSNFDDFYFDQNFSISLLLETGTNYAIGTSIPLSLYRFELEYGDDIELWDYDYCIGDGALIFLQDYGVRAVPEPSTMFFFGIGLVGLVGGSRKKFKKR